MEYIDHRVLYYVLCMCSILMGKVFRRPKGILFFYRKLFKPHKFKKYSFRKSKKKDSRKSKK